MNELLGEIDSCYTEKVPSFRIHTVPKHFFRILSPTNTKTMQLNETKQSSTPQISHWITALKSNINPLFGYPITPRGLWHQVIPNLFKHDRMALLFVL